MSKLAWLLTVATLDALALSGCAREEPRVGKEVAPKPEPPAPVSVPLPDWGLVTNGGFDSEAGWTIECGMISDGRALLQKTADCQRALLKQVVSGVQPGSDYLLRFTAKADARPTKPVVADLLGRGRYKSPEGGFGVRSTDIGPEPAEFEKVIRSGEAPPKVTLRIYTSSAVPVVIDNVSLTKLG